MKIYLLGPPKVILQNGQPAEISSDSEQALLAYLAVEKNKTHQRESLSTLLWPESEGKQARNNLRVSLHRLRQALQDDAGEIILASKQELQINSKASIWLDVDEFANLLEEVKIHSQSHLAQCEHCAGKLAEAVDLYRGDFLQGSIVEGSHAFQEWMIFNQEWLQRRVLDGLFDLVEIYTYQQEYRMAEQYVRQQLELEPWREKAHRQLMCVLALRGERTAALAQYEHCSRILTSEFAAEPSDETKNLFEEIRSGQLQENVKLGQAMAGFTPTGWKRTLLIAVMVVVLVGAGLAGLRGSGLSHEIGSGLLTEQDLYDDFSETSFEGAYDTSKWTERDGPEANCEIVQQDSVLRISHNKPELFSGCTLRVKQPLSEAGGELGYLSARMQLLDSHNGGFTGTVLRITTELQGGGWAAACGILADFNSVHVLFDVIDLRFGEAREDHLMYETRQVVGYNTWYEVLLQLDENAERIACLLDGQVIGEYAVSNPQELADAQMNREVGIWHEVDAEATSMIDDVFIHPAK
ncbi:MAG: hypothetical protein DWQ07_15450 [Chloroflexi bacterium]|nr:MAG: hypothetical protein DWQ07_15450 [Chloroflexota bacterium]